MAYSDPTLFELANAVIVPSQFSREHYQRRLGLECIAIASPISWTRILCEPDLERRYVTFVNPQPSKGVFFVAQIALELQRLRPGIGVLVVEGRGKAASWLERSGLDLSQSTNLHRMANTPDPRDFYRVSRLVLMPSIAHETFGRVAAEAMVNGIPVLASNRGALPEVIGTDGLLFDVPARYIAQPRLVPTADEVAPWVETILRLWDDENYFQSHCGRCLSQAERWRPERIAERYDAMLSEIVARGG